MQSAKKQNKIIDSKSSSRVLAVHYHIPLQVEDGNAYCPFYFGLWVDELSKYFSKIKIFSYIKQSDFSEYKIQSKNIEIISLGKKPENFLSSILNIKKQMNIFRRSKDEYTYICFRVPTFLAIYATSIIGFDKVVFLFVGNMYKMIGTTKLALWKSAILKIYWGLDLVGLSILGRYCKSFVIGEQFFKEYPLLKNATLTFTSTVTNKKVLITPKNKRHQHFTVTFLGRISPEKGLKYALLALADLRDENVILKIIGDTNCEEYENLKAQISRLKLNEIVEFTGSLTEQDDIYSELDKSDALILPSIWDGQTRAIWEGMARGLPVIASRGIGALAGQFKHKRDLLFVDSGSAQDIITVVRELMKNEHLYDKLSQASISIARRRTIEQSVSDFVQNLPTN